MGGSEIRALFAVLNRPETISLAGGAPWLGALPPDRVADYVASVLATDSARALQYGPAQGLPELRESLAGAMALEGIEADPRHLLVTDGAQQALELLAKVFVDPGDVVLAEAPTYVGAIQAFRSHQADVRGLAMDDEGLRVEALEEALAALGAEGRRAKFLYLVPTFQNPSGLTLAADRREQVLELCARHDLLVIEDNPYAMVRFEGEPVQALSAIAPDQVIYLGTLSKVFSPGMRIGWIWAPELVLRRLELMKEAANLCSSSFTQLVADAYLRSGHSQSDLDLIRKVYRERRDAMIDSVAQHFPAEAVLRPPEGGLFCWAELPAPMDTKSMLPRALEAGVAYVPGTAFFPEPARGRAYMRLNFSYPSPEAIEEGVRRLGVVVHEEMELGRGLGLS